MSKGEMSRVKFLNHKLRGKLTLLY